MRVLITGANRGLGFELTELMTSKGHFVLAGVRENGNHNNLLKIQKMYPDLIKILLIDVSEEKSIIKASETVKSEYDSIDVIINNAGILLSREKRIDNLEISEIRKTFDTNTFGPYMVIKYFLPLLYKGEEQCVINISSEAGSISSAGTYYCSYSMSKAALNLMTQMFSKLLQEMNIRVLAVHPGRMNTDMGADNAQIEPLETALGIYDIITGKIVINSEIKFVDYLGKPMPL